MKRIINKWRSIPNSAKSSIAFVFSSLLVKGFVFIVTPIFTRIMSMDDFGVVTTYNSWISIIEIFAILGLTSAGVFNVGLKDNKKTRDEYISSCLGLCNLTTFIVFITIVVFKIIFGNNFILDNKYLLIMFIHFLFNPAQIFWLTRQRYEYKYKFATIVSIFSVLIAQILSVVGVVLFSKNAALFKIVGNEIGTLIFAIPIYMMLLKRGKDYVNLNRWKKILVLALPLIPHYLAQHVMASSDKIMIAKYVSSSNAAIYGVVANISMIGTIFWNAVNASLVPYTFDKIENNQYKLIDNLCKKLLVGYFLILIAIVLVAPEILAILAPKSYHGGIYCVPPLIFVIFLSALYNLFANVEFYNKKTKGIAVATVIAASINLVLNYLLIPKYSYVGAAYTTLISNIVLIICHYYNYKKTPTNNIYNIKFIFMLCLIFFCISMLCNLLYFSNILRYVFIAILFVVMIYKRKNLLKVIQTVKKNG